MKSFLFISLVVCLFSSTALSAEPDNFVCATTGSSQSSGQTGGRYITSQGTLKVLVVFARFKDDTDPNPWWPVGGNPDGWNTWIDPNIQTGSTHEINLTNYYKTMSLGTFNVIGQAVSVETPQNKSYYGSNFYLATKEVLQQKVDPLVNFNDFDNWTYNSDFNHSNQSDGSVDMIIMIWRGRTWIDYYGWYGIAHLGDGPSYTVENGTKTIKTSFYGNGSGVTSNAWGSRDERYTFHAAIHEVAHWLLGGGHPYSAYTHSVWGMLVSSSIGMCANTYEREKLAWIYPTLITEDIINAPLGDYITTGTAYKYHPSNGSANEYYYFENHQKLNIYDDATVNTNDKGVFVVHQGGEYQSGDYIRVKTSNGQWNWSNPSVGNCSFYGNPLPNFISTSVNRAGANNRDKFTDAYGNSDWLFILNGVCGGYNNGENVNNSFNLSYNDVFSPYSNPYTHTWNNAQNNFTMEVTGSSGSIVNARFYLTNPTEGKPSKPQNTAVAVYTGGGEWNPKITWAAMQEPDVTSGGNIFVERSRKLATGYWTAWSTIATLAGTATQYIDQTISQSGSGNDSLKYRVRAKDSQNKYSIYSDEVKINYMLIAQKRGVAEKAPKQYALIQNFPNPFNPSTTFQFELPDDEHVTLKVFDMLGKEVATVVNGFKQKGYYEEQFDASSLTSGMYVYRLTAGQFTASKKMILMK